MYALLLQQEPYSAIWLDLPFHANNCSFGKAISKDSIVDNDKDSVTVVGVVAVAMTTAYMMTCS